MKLNFLVATVLAASLAISNAGSIAGTVRAQGKEGADAGAAGGKYDSHQFKFVERVNYEEMSDFIVYIDGPLTNLPISLPAEPKQVVTKRVKQTGALFDPHVLPVMVGTTVEWPNNDQILHNVFSYSEPAKFDLGLYKSPHLEKWKFEKPGRVDVFCSIHTRMNCIVLVLQNPFFAAANEKGKYSITNVPPGAYKLKAWHERLPEEVKDITVPESGDLKVDFTLGIKNLPKG